jgi:hypothetical protein
MAAARAIYPKNGGDRQRMAATGKEWRPRGQTMATRRGYLSKQWRPRCYLSKQWRGLMARRPAASDPGADGLFGLPARRRGRHERAMEATIRLWRSQGKTVDPAASVSLRSQAAAVDLAEVKADYWHIGNANRVLMELRAGYIDDRIAGTDPFDAFLREMSDDDGDDAAAGAGAQVRDRPA